MKVRVKSSWMHPLKGKIYKAGTVLEIEAHQFNDNFLEKVVKKAPKKSK